jgi:predicted nucleic acid-binding Zn ribbon protein
VRRARGPSGEDRLPGVRLGKALEDYLARSGLTAALKYPKLHEIWRNVVGEDLAGHARVASFRRGTLEVAVDSSALLNDIQFHQAALLRDMQREVKRPFVSRISFVLAAWEDDERSEERGAGAAG